MASSSLLEDIKRFDVVTDYSDHHYGTKKFTGSTALNKRIMNEWKILDKNLPDSIYVRVYETRIDLLRAAIIGAAGTPYHDGLFVFDIAFPSNYPTQPPKVYYHSHGLRLNPNLYASGFVCLSLLNTWKGQKDEKWNLSKSTLLQVLVSLQGLVLNEKPFFNEPGYGSGSQRSRFESRSRSYSNEAFLLSCKTMLFTLRKPPKNFEGLVSEHFRERARVILSACNAYANCRVRVGYYKDDGGSSESGIRVSRGFVKSIQKIYPQLVVEFQKNGASLGDFVEHLNVARLRVESLRIVGIRVPLKLGVIGKVKSILGLKNHGSNIVESSN